jgi:hypothetical protein
VHWAQLVQGTTAPAMTPARLRGSHAGQQRAGKRGSAAAARAVVAHDVPRQARRGYVWWLCLATANRPARLHGDRAICGGTRSPAAGPVRLPGGRASELCICLLRAQADASPAGQEPDMTTRGNEKLGRGFADLPCHRHHCRCTDLLPRARVMARQEGG